jgi:hypothetical protein
VLNSILLAHPKVKCIGVEVSYNVGGVVMWGCRVTQSKSLMSHPYIVPHDVIRRIRRKWSKVMQCRCEGGG